MTIAAGIIAAGEGTRLAAANQGAPKPMTAVAGSPLCRWVVQSLAKSGIREATILLNSRGGSVRRFLEGAFPELAWTFLEKDTPSSWESFRLVAGHLARRHADFLVTTVDAIVPPAETARFCAQARSSGAGTALALTGFIDDEKPLWADLSEKGLVSALGGDAVGRKYATAGLYYLTAPLAESLAAAPSFTSLREFLADLVRRGEPVAGVPLSKTVDVDRPEDIAVAADFIKENGALA